MGGRNNCDETQKRNSNRPTRQTILAGGGEPSHDPIDVKRTLTEKQRTRKGRAIPKNRRQNHRKRILGVKGGGGGGG